MRASPYCSLPHRGSSRGREAGQPVDARLAARHDAVRLHHHLQRFNTPEQTARFIAFLHSLEHTSGQIFQIDSRPGSWL